MAASNPSQNLTDDGQIRHISRQSAKPLNSANGSPESAIRRLVAWLTPFTKVGYPGRYRFWHIITPGYAPNTVKHWITCHKKTPPAVLRSWAEQAREHCRQGLAIAAELDAAAAALEARPPHPGTANLRRYRAKKRASSPL